VTAVRRAIVSGLRDACTLADRLWSWPPPFRWIAARLGCPSGLALWSAQLDERWRTGVWTETIR
jgi:hypothetical protein